MKARDPKQLRISNSDETREALARSSVNFSCSPSLKSVVHPGAMSRATSAHQAAPIRRAHHLDDVRYEIRGPLARRAHELERQGFEIIKLNIGNPAQFGFRTPETMRLAMIENLSQSEGYCHQKGIFTAREAVVMDTQSRGIAGVNADDVFMGNGVSELILMSLEALLNPGEEVLVPAPDYPLWTAAVSLCNGRPVHYPCRAENGFLPDPEEIERLITPATRAIVVINPNNPTGAVYPRALLESIAQIAEKRKLVVYSDEIYDRILYDGAKHVPMATVCHGTLCATFGGLSKVYRACGLRTGWIFFTGTKDHAIDYIEGLEVLASLRLCANVPSQWAVQTALGGHQSIYDLTAETGRLGLQRRAVLQGIERSEFMQVVPPMGALYAFPSIDTHKIPDFNDARFAIELLEHEHVLVVPGSSFNIPHTNHLRLTLLPDEDTMNEVFVRMERLLLRMAH
jgi:alanine-synthesizing transaminase